MGRVGGARGRPTVGAGIVSPAGVQTVLPVISAPDNHFAAGPDCRVSDFGAEGALVVLVAVQLSVLGLYLPPVFKWMTPSLVRPRRSFRCWSRLLCDQVGQRARWWCWWPSNCRCWDCIFPPVFKSQQPPSFPPQTIISLPVHTAV